MRHHTTSIVGPDLDGPEMRECKCVDGPGPCGRFIKHTVRNDRQIEVCCGCGAETDVGPAWTDCIKASDLEPPSKSNHSETPNSCQAPAQPSVGENVMRAIHVASGRSGVELTQSLRDTMRPMALAVRREVLAEPFTDEDVKAADKAFMAFRGGGRTDWIRAALSAALASRVKRAEREGKQ